VDRQAERHVIQLFATDETLNVTVKCYIGIPQAQNLVLSLTPVIP
jgi:hypothetical protein